MFDAERERARQETSGFKVPLLAAYYFVMGNYSLIVILSGLGMMAYGATILSGRPAALFEVLSQLPDALWILRFPIVEHQVFAGMFGVWGASFVLIGVAAYAVLWANQLYARLSTDSEAEDETDSGPDLDSNSL